MTNPDPEVELAVHALAMEDPLGDLVRVVFPIPPAPVMPTTRTFSRRSLVVNASTSVFASFYIFSLLAALTGGCRVTARGERGSCRRHERRRAH
jgi:hypothetical protein